MSLYLKRRWNEFRGDKYDAWGKSWWYFEVNPDGSALRQIEQYDSGVSLRYGAEQNEDEYGFLSDQTVDVQDPDFEAISAAEFELMWHQSRAPNVES